MVVFFQGLKKCVLCVATALLAITLRASTPQNATENQIPVFGCDTVLVWKTQSEDYTSEFVVRIAEFLPDRFFEWEDMRTQGTIFIPHRDILNAKGFVNSHLFKSGVDARSRNATTLWLSRQAYLKLKEKKRIKHEIDGFQAWIEYQGNDQLMVKVNRTSMMLPVIKTTDDRGSERWFLDQEENPLMVKHSVRIYSQILDSITTDRSNTLRWIKGKKLKNPPR